MLSLLYSTFEVLYFHNQGDKSEQRVLFDSIDYNRDGVLTTEEITYFRPCPQTNKTTLVTRLNTLGPRVNYDQFENDVSRNMSSFALI